MLENAEFKPDTSQGYVEKVKHLKIVACDSNDKVSSRHRLLRVREYVRRVSLTGAVYRVENRAEWGRRGILSHRA